MSFVFFYKWKRFSNSVFIFFPSNIKSAESDRIPTEKQIIEGMTILINPEM